MKKSVRAILALITSSALAVLGSGVANASPNGTAEEKSEIVRALDRVSLLDESKMVESAVSAKDSLGRIALGAGEITVPEDVRDGVTFTSPDDSAISVEPTTSTKWNKPFVMDNGGVTYTSNEGYAESVIVGDGSVQMLTTINETTAPTEYHYTVHLEAGQKLQFSEGTPVVLNEDGTVELAVEAPWAVDAHGNSVPTHYEIKGNVLTQVVDHSELRADSYPVVADPVWIPAWLFRCLVGMGINSASILRSAEMGSFWGVFGKAAWHCIRGR